MSPLIFFTNYFSFKSFFVLFFKEISMFFMFLNHLTKWKNTYCKNCINEKVSHDMRGKNKKHKKMRSHISKFFVVVFFLFLLVQTICMKSEIRKHLTEMAVCIWTHWFDSKDTHSRPFHELIMNLSVRGRGRWLALCCRDTNKHGSENPKQ